MAEEKKYDSFPWLIQAANGEEMPSGLDLVDIVCYQSLRHLYASFKLKIVTKETATKEKDNIINEWISRKKKEDDRVVMFNRFGSLYNEVSVQMSEYNKNPCAETAIAFTDKCKDVLFKTAQ